jgi:predicted phosphodiesterase
MIELPPDGRLGILGDVHAEHVRLGQAIRFLLEQGATHLLCTGDIADGTGSVARCVALLQEFHVFTVRGNHDRWLLDNQQRSLPDATHRNDLKPPTLAFLENLPATLTFATPLGRILLCHGLGENDMAKVTPDDFGYALKVNDDLQALIADPEMKLVINGHSHRPMLRHFGGLTVLNAGTLREDHQPGCVIVDLGSASVRFFEWHPDQEDPFERSRVPLAKIAEAQGS